MTSMARVVALCAFASMVLGCRSTVDVSIESDDTGGGSVTVTVELDSEAVDLLGGVDVLQYDDLEGTSWVVSDPEETSEGGYRITAERGFVDAGDLQAALEELAGPGVFSDVVSVVEHGFARTDAELSLDASVSGDPAQFSDEALTETLGGLPLGYTPEELAFIGATEPGAATMTIRVKAPGGEPDEVTLDLVSGKPQTATAASSGRHRNGGVLVLGGAGVLLASIGLLLLLTGLLRRWRT